MRVLLFILFFTNVCILQAGEEYLFTWNSGKEEVGELEVSKEVINDETVYSYSSVINVNVGVEMNMQEVWEAIYSKDHLLSYAKVENAFNGKPRIEITESKNEDRILRNVNGREKSADRPEVSYSYILLFIEAPVGLIEVYSELYGTMFSVDDNGKNTYTITDSKNRNHRFFYDEDGHLKKAEIELSVGSFTLLPKE